MDNKILDEMNESNNKKNISIHLKISTIKRLNSFKENQIKRGYKKPKNSELIDKLLNNFFNKIDEENRLEKGVSNGKRN